MIVDSAIKFQDKEHKNEYILLGKRHADIFERMSKSGIDYDKNTAIQGFWAIKKNEQQLKLNNDKEVEYTIHQGQFLDRYEAKKYAIECGQIKESEFAELYSEDLWPPKEGESI